MNILLFGQDGFVADSNTAFSFCNCLDGIKGGISIKKDVKKEDSAMFDKFQLPKSRGGQPGYTTNHWATPRKTAARDESLGTDIIERLWRAGQEARVCCPPSQYNFRNNTLITFTERIRRDPQSPTWSFLRRWALRTVSRSRSASYGPQESCGVRGYA